ncbi:hypothetical protein [Acetobacter aceti]|uniref:Uncharacterized protein n=1 Tax=Acetobacter aceti TaxID=435 RepID=A0A6S6PNR6_ACEAC|nr:hypothetical protein [Acetobacter aceti]BCI68285.1 hypothetical protein AAJCM20276_29090 [Acetobacter aceti]
MDIEIFGRTMWLYGIEGTVYGLRKWTSTSVQTSGTATTYEIGPGVYSTHGPKVTSTVNQHQECWIRSPGGREKQLQGVYAVADTQTVRVVWGALKGVDAGPDLVVRNVGTGKGWSLNGNLPTDIQCEGTSRLTLQYILAIVVIGTLAEAVWYMMPDSGIRGHNLPDTFVACVFLTAIPLSIAGFIHRASMVNRNRQKAMAIILKAISDNPDFRKTIQK